MSSIYKQIHELRPAFAHLALGSMAMVLSLLSPQTLALPALAGQPAQDCAACDTSSVLDDVLPERRLYRLRYADRIFNGRQDFMLGLSVNNPTSDSTGVVPGFNTGGLEAEPLKFDAQSRYSLDPHTVSAQLTYLRKNPVNTLVPLAPSYAVTDWTASTALTNAAEMINTLRKKFSYVYQGQFGGSLTFFQRSGTTYELFWTPAQNIRLGAQYTASRKGNGVESNYNGYGLNPGESNWFGYLWLTY